MVKRTIDAAMTALLPVMMAYNLTGNTIHEVTGMALFALFILHHLLNRGWYGSVFAGKRNAPGLLHMTVTILLALAMIGMAVSAVMVSRVVFAFANLKGGLDARKLHVCMATWGFILMAIHLGFHGNMVTGILMKPMKGGDSRLRKAVLRVAAAMISAYGVHASFTHEIGSKLTMYYGFSFWDPDRNKLFFLADLFAVMGLYACASHYCMNWIRLIARRTRGKP